MILVLGGNGYLATEFGAFFTKNEIPHRVISRKDFDYASRPGLEEMLSECQPTFLINAAGYTGIPNVDASESNKSRCLLANTALPALLAEACAQRQLPWGHLSTGCIYSGRRPDGSGFTEKDPPNFSFRHNNCSFYSGTKALAEEILAGFDNVYIWRFRRPFNHLAHPRNYLSKVLSYERQLETENSITWLDDFLKACWTCIRDRPKPGIYNIVNPGIIKTSEILALLESHGLSQKPFSFFQSEEEFYSSYRTPRSECILDSSKIISHGIPLTEVHDSIDWCLKNWKKNGCG